MLTDIDKVIAKTDVILDIINKFGFIEPVKIYFGTQEEINNATALQITAASSEGHSEPLKMRSFVQVQLVEQLGFDVIFKSSNSIGSLYIEHFNNYSANIQDVDFLKEKLSAKQFSEKTLDDFISNQLLLASEKYSNSPSYGKMQF